MNKNPSLSLRARLLRYLVLWLTKPAFNQNATPASRAHLDKLARMALVAPGSTVTHKPLGGVPTEWVNHPASGARGFVLYLHGGGYVTCSPRTHRSLTSRLARAARVCVVVPDYRLAPENPHPAAVDDALAAYRGLLDQGIPARDIVIGGDSAGGGLTLALALRIKALGLPQPAGLLLLSPWTDLTLSGTSMRDPAVREWVLSPVFIAKAAQDYMAGQDPLTPTGSPLFADLAGLPPLFIQVGTDEVLLDDSTRLAQRATAQQVPTTLQIWPQMWHVWQMYGGQIPEADRAIQAMADFVHDRLTKEF
jgi:epsilon-lactone hydrolase